MLKLTGIVFAAVVMTTGVAHAEGCFGGYGAGSVADANTEQMVLPHTPAAELAEMSTPSDSPLLTVPAAPDGLEPSSPATDTAS